MLIVGSLGLLVNLLMLVVLGGHSTPSWQRDNNGTRHSMNIITTS